MLSIERILEFDDFCAIFLESFHSEFFKPFSWVVCFDFFEMDFLSWFYTKIIDIEMWFTHKKEKERNILTNRTLFWYEMQGFCGFFIRLRDTQK